MVAPAVPVAGGTRQYVSVEVSQGLRVSECVYAPGVVLAPHVHERTLVAVLLGGRLDFDIGGRHYAGEPHAVISVPAGEVHANRCQGVPSRNLVLELDPRLAAADLASCAALLQRTARFCDPGVAELGRRTASELRHRDSVSPLAVEALALELLAAAHRQSRTRAEATGRLPAWLVQARDILHDGFLQPLRLSGIAQDVGVHRVHLARTFRARFGRSVGTYQRELRVRWAAERLVRSDESLGDIATAAGFADQSHFTRVFRRLTGTTPLRYRSAHRSGLT